MTDKEQIDKLIKIVGKQQNDIDRLEKIVRVSGVGKLKCWADKSKEEAKKELASVMHRMNTKTVVEFGLIEAKIVTVKADRNCCKCGKTIKTGSNALTSSKRDEYGRKTRQYRCLECSEQVIGSAKCVSEEQNESDTYWDAFDLNNNY